MARLATWGLQSLGTREFESRSRHRHSRGHRGPAGMLPPRWRGTEASPRTPPSDRPRAPRYNWRQGATAGAARPWQASAGVAQAMRRATRTVARAEAAAAALVMVNARGPR